MQKNQKKQEKLKKMQKKLKKNYNLVSKKKRHSSIQHIISPQRDVLERFEHLRDISTISDAPFKHIFIGSPVDPLTLFYSVYEHMEKTGVINTNINNNKTNIV